MQCLFGGGRSIVLVLLALAPLLPAAAMAQSQNDAPSADRERQLLSRLGDDRVERSDATGNVTVIGTSKQDAIERPAGLQANASPVEAARAHLSEYGALFGIKHNSSAQKKPRRRTRTVPSCISSSYTGACRSSAESSTCS